MEIKQLKLEGTFLCTPRIFKDERGSFLESYNHKQFCIGIGRELEFVQDNHSISKKGVFRGLHFQNPPFTQDKLVRVTKGAVLDVFLDLRKNSPTYGVCDSVKLTAESFSSLFIPAGFAHGFLALEEETHFLYKCSAYYAPSHEATIDYRTVKQLNLPSQDLILNNKDLNGEDFTSFNSPF
ncbi:MAG: dTDP-4-dehydrorhamnose 3,5-epimerase [Flavobacteriales bacterium]